VNKKNEKEITENKKDPVFYYNREDRKENSRLKRPSILAGLGYFRSGKGKFSLILIFVTILSLIWMSQRIKSISGIPDGSFLSRGDIYYRLYAFSVSDGREISIQFFIKNKKDEEAVVRFRRLYVIVIDSKTDKIVFKKDFFSNASLILESKKTEILPTQFTRAQKGKTYYIRAVLIDKNSDKYLLNYTITH